MAFKLWGGRFKKKADPDFEAYSASLKTDRRLLPYDLLIDAAHVKALKKCGVLNAAEAKKLLSALAALESLRRSGKLKLDPKAEDIHSAVQTLLQARVGDLADKIHAGRSRNDLVSQSTRLYCKEHSQIIRRQIGQLQKAFTVLAEKNQEVLVPGMTHLQNAQVVSLAHIFLAYNEMLSRAKARLDGAYPFFDVCVLGSGALAGTTFALDQHLIARELGLSKVTNNSYDVAGDRDFALNFISCLYFLGLGVSRMAEDLMLGQTGPFSLIDVDQQFCTGSSMMPQKKNADFLELTRGAAAVLGGNFAGITILLKGLPTSYNRDLQWDKKFLFDSVEITETQMTVLIKMARTLRINRARAAELLKDESLYATDLADYLVKRGVPFKQAHDQVGQLIFFAEENKVPLSKIGLDIFRRFAPRSDGTVYDLFHAEHSVRLKKTQGSTHPDQIKKQIARWKKELRDASI